MRETSPSNRTGEISSSGSRSSPAVVKESSNENGTGSSRTESRDRVSRAFMIDPPILFDSPPQSNPALFEPPRRRARLPRRHAPARPLTQLWAVACRSVAGIARPEFHSALLLRSRLLREAVPPPGLTHGLKSHCEPRGRRRFPEEVMGDEHGRKVLVSCYFCEEPSAAAGSLVSRPAAACRRGKCRRPRGDF